MIGHSLDHHKPACYRQWHEPTMTEPAGTFYVQQSLAGWYDVMSYYASWSNSLAASYLQIS